VIRWGSLALGACLLLVLAAAASALSCRQDERTLDEQVAQERIVIVGTPVAQRRDVATFRVEERWKGPVLPQLLDVQLFWAGFHVGSRYLVFLHQAEPGEPFTTSGCDPNQLWSEDLAAARPIGATLMYEPVVRELGGRQWVPLAAAVGLLAAGAASAWGVIAGLRRRENRNGLPRVVPGDPGSG